MFDGFGGFEELLRANGARFAERPALLTEKGGRPSPVTYGELLGAVLRKRDVFRSEKRSCVAMYAPATPDWVVTLFASVLAGMRTVVLDVAQPPEIAGPLLRAAGADYAYASPEDRARLEQFLAKPANCAPEGEGRLLFYTSGTTAAGRAVVLSAAAFCRSAWNGQQMLPCGPGDVILSELPLSHVFGFVCTLLWPLSFGAAAALGRGMRYFTGDPGFFRPTIFPVVPSLIRFLAAAGALNPELKTVLVGASPCDEATLDAIRASGREVRFGYGLTETASGVAISTDSADPFSMALCPDTKLRIGPGGEIFLRTACMMDGYDGDAAATEAVLRDGELATGDLGELDGNGRLHITGRKKDILILPNGTKIFCPEWEQSLSALLGTEAAVVLRGGRPALVAVGAEEQRGAFWKKVEWFNGALPIDRQIASLEIRDTPLPRTATGKLRRWAICSGEEENSKGSGT